MLPARVALPDRITADAIGRCRPGSPLVTLSGAALGTSWSVRLVGDAVDVDGLRARIDARIAAIAAEMSQWEPHSHLSRFNQAPAGSWFTLPADFTTVIAAALDIAEGSGGAFDPTFGRTATLMGFGAVSAEMPPDAAALDAAAAAAGWRRLAFDPAGRRLRQPGGVWLDLSAIGKGFAVDAVAALLEVEEIGDALVEIGGELVGIGLKPDGQPWWVELEVPDGIQLPPFRIALHGIAVATSGDYVRGPHTFDPATGRALPPRVASVSVVHASAMLADGWATALTVLGPERGAAIADREGIAARMIVHDDGATYEWLSTRMLAMLGD